MKNRTLSVMATTALMVVLSAVSSAVLSAATPTPIKVEIPFAFQVAGKTMAPGAYVIRPATSETNFQMSNAKSGESTFVNVLSPHDPQKNWKTQDGGILRFTCSDSNCALVELWTNRGLPAHYIPNPEPPAAGKPTHVALIRAAASK